MTYFKGLLVLTCTFSLSACQVISPIFVNYNGVRMDVASWINKHPLMSMQQKRSLVELSKAQQRLNRFHEYDAATRFDVTLQNQKAMYCAQQSVSNSKIKSLQEKIYGESLDQIMTQYQQLRPQIKLDVQQINCSKS
jgi:hypothetical protein